MHKPTSIKLRGYEWDVTFVENDLGDAVGYCAPSKHQIIIDVMTDRDNRMSDGAILHTFLHEVLHAIDATYCDCRVFQGAKHGDENEFMNPFCEGLVQFLLDNWNSLEKMKKTLDKP